MSTFFIIWISLSVGTLFGFILRGLFIPHPNPYLDEADPKNWKL